MKREAKAENELIKKAQDGDKQAVQEILSKYKNLVRSIARRYTLQGGETEDLIQEGMVGLFSAIGDYNEDKGMSFKNFACLLVKQRIYDAIKSAMRKKNSPMNNYVSIFQLEGELTGNAEEEFLEDESGKDFIKLLGKILSNFELRVLLLYVDGLAYAEIAETVKKDVKSVENAIQRCRRKIQTEIYKKQGDK